MTDTVKDEGKEAVNINEIINNINANVDKKLDIHTQRISEKLDALKPEQKAKKKEEDDSFDWGFDEEEEGDEPVTKKSLTQLAKKNDEEIDRKVEQKLDQKLSLQSERAQFDSKAFKEFPELGNETSDFTKATLKEMNEQAAYIKKTYGLKDELKEIINNDPRIFYNSAREVANKNPKFRVEQNLERENQEYNNSRNSFEMSSGKKESNGPTARQLQIARSMNLSPEKLKNYITKQKGRK